jgi:hypothetical protein
VRRRGLFFLTIVFAAGIAAAVAFGPRVVRRARVRALAADIAAIDTAKRWAAQRALLELPREQTTEVLPGVVTEVVAEVGAAGESEILVLGPLKLEKEFGSWLFTETYTAPVRETLISEKREGLLYILYAAIHEPTADAERVREDLRALARSADGVVAVARITPGSEAIPSIDAVLLAPLDREGRTLELIRERLRPTR